jgi:hypothetical protein
LRPGQVMIVSVVGTADADTDPARDHRRLQHACRRSTDRGCAGRRAKLLVPECRSARERGLSRRRGRHPDCQGRSRCRRLNASARQNRTDRRAGCDGCLVAASFGRG